MLLTDIKNEARGRVRPLARHDVPVVAAMIARLAGQHEGLPHVDAATLEAELRTPVPRVRGLVAERFGYVVGYALVAMDEPMRALNLQQIFIIEGSRGRGLGRALAEAAVEMAREAGCGRLVAHVPANCPHARGFYAALGFDGAGEYPVLALA